MSLGAWVVEEDIGVTELALFFLLLELGWIRTVGFEVEAEKTYFRRGSLKMKALFSERPGRRPVQDLKHVPEIVQHFKRTGTQSEG